MDSEGPIGKEFVRDLQDKQAVHSIFLARDKALLTGKNGKPYLSVFLCDNSGSIDGRIWDNVETLNQSFQSGDMIEVKGQVQVFQGRKQVVIHRLEKATPEQFKVTDFVSRSSRAPEEMLQQLLQIVDEMQDANLRQLVRDVLNDPEIRPKILRAAAAKSIHHAYLGGLLEHILSICGIMKFLASHYENINLDYLIFGAIFHDIGKIWELDTDNGISYTDKGRLIGHMVMAVELVEKKASRILGFPEALKDLCKHIILSHHGKLEYGSPKTPMFLEAFLVAAIDDLDSKVNTIARFIESERQSLAGAAPDGSGGLGTGASSESWSKYNQLFDRCFFLKT
jgi:3'-5' exoribonuclease